MWIMGKMKDIIRRLEIARFLEALSWEPYETDPDRWQVRIIACNWQN